MIGSLRVSDEDEFEGLDVSEHSESAYAFGSGERSAASAALRRCGSPAIAFNSRPRTRRPEAGESGP